MITVIGKKDKIKVLALLEAYRLLVNSRKEDNIDHVIRVTSAIIADIFGYHSRADWSEEIRLAELIDYGYDADLDEQYKNLTEGKQSTRKSNRLARKPVIRYQRTPTI